MAAKIGLRICAIITAAWASCANSAECSESQEHAPRRFTFSGFGTLGIATVDHSDIKYRLTPLEDNGASNNPSAEFVSNLGVQGSFIATPKLSLTGQVVAQRTDDKFEPVLEWLFGKWQASDAVSIRLGRLGVPVYSVSDYRLVNYSHLWARPPVDFYSAVPITKMDGADVIFRHPVGEGIFGAQVYYGASQFTAGMEPRFKIKNENLIGLNLTYQLGDLSLRAGYAESKLKLRSSDPLAPFVAGLRAVSLVPGLSSLDAVANDFVLDDASTNFASVSANFERNNLVLIGEYAQRRTSGQGFPDTDSYALTAGYRIGKFTPWISRSQMRQVSPHKETRIPPAPFPDPALVQNLAILQATADALLNSPGASTWSAGVRWDFRDNFALKFQVDHTKPQYAPIRGLFGTFFDVPTGFKDSVNVYSLALDFVF